MIAELGIEPDQDSLVVLYVAGIASLGYGLRQLLPAQETAGAPVSAIAISGGAGRSSLVRQMLADTTGLPVAVPATEEPVLLGAAMLGSVAASHSADLETAMRAMSAIDEVFSPATGETAATHDARFTLFERMQMLARDAALRGSPADA